MPLFSRHQPRRLSLDKQSIPLETILQICDLQPRAVSTFVVAWAEADEDGYAIFDKKGVSDVHSMSWTKFKNDLRSLARIGLLEHRIDKDILRLTIYDTSIGTDEFE